MFASVLDPVINVLDPADISAGIRQLPLALADCARQLTLLDDLGLLALAFLVTCDLADVLFCLTLWLSEISYVVFVEYIWICEYVRCFWYMFLRSLWLLMMKLYVLRDDMIPFSCSCHPAFEYRLKRFAQYVCQLSPRFQQCLHDAQ